MRAGLLEGFVDIQARFAVTSGWIAYLAGSVLALED